MATRFELTINPGYVQNWTIEDAIRELYQNAFDNEILNPSKKAIIEYDEEKEQLKIISPDTILERKTLLLGSTTKSEDDDTVGVYGEGYKLAALVLLRNGNKIKIKNNKAKEEWLPKIIKSKRFNSDLIVMDIRTLNKSEYKSSDLTFVIEGISKATYLNTKKKILDIESIKKIETSYGDIILSMDYAGKIYTNRLFVSNNFDFVYGYNIKPKYIPIDRDRKNLNYYSLKDIINRMWIEVCDKKEDYFNFFYDLISKHSTELSSNWIIGLKRHHKLGILECFLFENRRNAIPVYTRKDREFIELFYKKFQPTSVTYALNEIIKDFFIDYFSKIPTKEERFEDSKIIKEENLLSPKQVLIELKSRISLSTTEELFFQAVIEESEDWIIASKATISLNTQDSKDILKLVKTGIV